MNLPYSYPFQRQIRQEESKDELKALNRQAQFEHLRVQLDIGEITQEEYLRLVQTLSQKAA